MKILLLYTYNQSFLSFFFTEVAENLVINGHDIVVFSLKNTDRTFVSKGVTYIISKKESYLLNYFKIFKLIKNQKPDVIISNFSYANPSLLFGNILGVNKNIVWMHSLIEQISPSKFQFFVKRNFLKLADKIISNSNLLKDNLYDYYNVPEIKIVVIPFWSTIASFKEEDIAFNVSENVIKIGCPGRLVMDKNQQLLLSVFKQILDEKNKEIHLFFAGNGSNRKELIKLTKELNIEDKVTFLGSLSSGQMLSFYKSMDCIVLPSLHESFGLVLIEVLALDKPVLVSSQFGALHFITEDISSFSFNPLKEDELYEKLVLLLGSIKIIKKDYYLKFYAQYFDAQKILKQIIKVIEK